MVQDPKSESPSPSPSQSTETTVDISKEIKDSMGAGKKHLLCSDYPDAVACFQEACKLLAEKYGQLSEECGDAYYYYGSSLLELSRLENGVLGNALKGVPEEDEESDKDDEQFEKPNLAEGDREKLREDVEAAMATEDDEEEGEEADKKEEGQKSEEEKKPNEKVEEEKKPEEKVEEEKKPEEKTEEEKAPEEPEKENEEISETTSTSKPAEPSSSKSEQSKESEEEGDDENPDDISNMQLAWEMLELARVLYKKREKSKDNSLMVAQCHLKLGELGLEGEQYPQAIADFLECLLVQKEHLAETDRKLAETHYNLGLAYSFEKRCDNALEHYQSALNVLEARVELLEELIETKVGQSGNEEDSMAECKEVGEIKELIPDINSKIEDVLSVKKQNEGKPAGLPFAQTGETSTGFGEASTSSSTTCSTIPIRKVAQSSSAKESTSDISHLVRRKRASPDEDSDAAEAGGDSKKAKQEKSDSNGHAADKNGDGSLASPNGDHKNGDGGRTSPDGDHKNGDGNRTSPEKTEAKEGDSAADLKNAMAAAGDAPVHLKNTVAAAGDAPVPMET